MARYQGDYILDNGYTFRLTSLEVYLVIDGNRQPTSRIFDLNYIPSSYEAALSKAYCRLPVRPRQFIGDIGINRFVHIPCFALPGSTAWFAIINELNSNSLFQSFTYRGELVNGSNANLFFN